MTCVVLGFGFWVFCVLVPFWSFFGRFLRFFRVGRGFLFFRWWDIIKMCPSTAEHKNAWRQPGEAIVRGRRIVSIPLCISNNRIQACQVGASWSTVTHFFICTSRALPGYGSRINPIISTVFPVHFFSSFTGSTQEKNIVQSQTDSPTGKQIQTSDSCTIFTVFQLTVFRQILLRILNLFFFAIQNFKLQTSKEQIRNRF